jgi:hypothetical protein
MLIFGPICDRLVRASRNVDSTYPPTIFAKNIDKRIAAKGSVVISVGTPSDNWNKALDAFKVEMCSTNAKPFSDLSGLEKGFMLNFRLSQSK